jgi:ribonuclease BN (tRNA processing enzyme)
MSFTRREIVSKSALAFAGAITGQRASLAQQPIPGRDRLVLLGTKGGPAIRAYSPSASANLLVYKGVPYVVDAGYGVTFKLLEAGLPLQAVRNVFVTHLHSDHYLELGNLIYNSWATGLQSAVDVYGPTGIKAVVGGYWESNRFDIEMRLGDSGRPDIRKLVTTHEYLEGRVFENADVKVTALRNVHPPITESFALKFEFGGKTIVFSGDTAYFPPLAGFARNADYLLHSVVYGPALEAMVARLANAPKLLEAIKSNQTFAEDVGRIAAQANVKTLVLNHFVPSDDKSLTPEVWTKAVRATFGGNIVVGKDLLELPL